MEIKHKGETIVLREQAGEWYVETDAYRYGNVDLNAVRNYIDKKAKDGFVRFRAYRKTYGANLGIVEITSIGDGGDIWYKTVDGDRGKDSPRDANKFYPMTEANNAVFERFAAKAKEHNDHKQLLDSLYQEQIQIAGELTGNAFEGKTEAVTDPGK